MCYFFFFFSVIDQSLEESGYNDFSFVYMSGQKRHGFGKLGELLAFFLGRPLKWSVYQVCIHVYDLCRFTIYLPPAPPMLQ